MIYCDYIMGKGVLGILTRDKITLTHILWLIEHLPPCQYHLPMFLTPLHPLAHRPAVRLSEPC